MSAVRSLRLSRVAILSLVALFTGCASTEHAHYVVRNNNSGIVAIREDTPELRAKAENLMHQQFPAGYVIDDVRVVAVGRPHHMHDEVMLYYHSGTAPAGAPVVVVGGPPGTVVVPHVPPGAVPAQPAPAPIQPTSGTAPPGGLPPEPIPVNAP
jgi:hypothetical protein